MKCLPVAIATGGKHGAMKASTVHNFRTDLAFSDAAGDEPFWDAVYRKAFPDMVGHILCNKDGLGQRSGIDRLVYLSSGRDIRIDEKKRREVYDDILLEYLSNDATNAPGWMDKSLQIDYIAYAFMPLRKVYLFPWDMLRRAWLNFKPYWMEKYPRIWAQNDGYKTWSLAVPIEEVKRSVYMAMIIQLKDAS